MNKEKRRVPKLRFPGFTEDWEQRKLSDISTKVTTKNVDVHYTETLTNSAEQGIISQVDFFDKEISNKDNINGYYIVENNDFIYNPRISTLAPVGPINRNKLNRTGIMSPLYTVFRASTVDLDFLEWYFQSSHWHRYMKLNGDSGARSDRIAIKDSTFFDMPIKIPVNIKEQVLIGETLEMFNQYITLHQRKLEHLNLKKKALLQKLFPKNGERYPEFRFPGFTDAWEQRKLGEVVTINPKTELPDEFKYVDLESVVGTNLLGFQVIKKENAPSRAQRLASYGDVFYQTVRPYQRNNYLFENVDKDMVFSTGYAQLRSKLDSYFLLTLVQNDNFVKVVLDNCTGTSYPAINGSELGKITVQIPSNEAEANQIGKVFRGIDKSITLHQRKLEHLQLQKKALLQQLFI